MLLDQPHFHRFWSHLLVQDLQALQILSQLFLGINRECFACAEKPVQFTTTLWPRLSVSQPLWSQLVESYWLHRVRLDLCRSQRRLCHVPHPPCGCLRGVRGTLGGLKLTVLCRSKETDCFPILCDFFFVFMPKQRCLYAVPHRTFNEIALVLHDNLQSTLNIQL